MKHYKHVSERVFEDSGAAWPERVFVVNAQDASAALTDDDIPKAGELWCVTEVSANNRGPSGSFDVRAVYEKNTTLAHEAAWVRRKLGLPADATTSDVQGQLHILYANSHGYVKYIMSYKCNDKQGEIARLSVALAESVSLQSHYAALLNAYDGGERMIFNTAEEWLARLATLAAKPHEKGMGL